MTIFLTLALYCLVIVAASILGGFVPLLVRMTHTRMQIMMSFIAGLMLGVSFFHLLPHAVEEIDSVDQAMLWMTGGFVTMLLLLRAFHFHGHEPVPLPHGETAADHAGHPHDAEHENGHSHARHDHAHHHDPQLAKRRMNWVGIAIGMSLHTLMDGFALAANVVAETEETGPRLLLGMGTFLAIALHKPLDSLSITSIMTASGWSTTARHWANLIFALMCPLGCAIFVLGIDRLVDRHHLALGAVLGLSAGGFLCISAADLMPELELHAHDRVRLSLALVLGVALAYGMHLVEPPHGHDHEERHHEHEVSTGTAGWTPRDGCDYALVVCD
ncbi:MAG TPA: ZIP family metal transporter [Pirellulales bacterium]|nr:ZIP family metal transporter [Pirellulales bacterium]